jgi:hypothetical protein
VQQLRPSDIVRRAAPPGPAPVRTHPGPMHCLAPAALPRRAQRPGDDGPGDDGPAGGAVLHSD